MVSYDDSGENITTKQKIKKQVASNMIAIEIYKS